uniref:Uncharacterized protein n=1 Tax=Acrobeloides nanus TaxID=290746 RepID=A0A914E0Q1_9BILA
MMVVVIGTDILLKDILLNIGEDGGGISHHGQNVDSVIIILKITSVSNGCQDQKDEMDGTKDEMKGTKDEMNGKDKMDGKDEMNGKDEMKGKKDEMKGKDEMNGKDEMKGKKDSNNLLLHLDNKTRHKFHLYPTKILVEYLVTTIQDPKFHPYHKANLLECQVWKIYPVNHSLHHQD